MYQRVTLRRAVLVVAAEELVHDTSRSSRRNIFVQFHGDVAAHVGRYLRSTLATAVGIVLDFATLQVDLGVHLDDTDLTATIDIIVYSAAGDVDLRPDGRGKDLIGQSAYRKILFTTAGTEDVATIARLTDFTTADGHGVHGLLALIGQIAYQILLVGLIVLTIELREARTSYRAAAIDVAVDDAALDVDLAEACHTTGQEAEAFHFTFAILIIELVLSDT